jgi:hypothetical protein
VSALNKGGPLVLERFAHGALAVQVRITAHLLVDLELEGGAAKHQVVQN